MPQRRQVIDYALARRATLAELARGQKSAADVCDAHPDLMRAARYYGEATETGCPICRKKRLTRVTYAYGNELQHASGRARPTRSLDALAARCRQVRIYLVEVCRSCGWNHLLLSFLIGTATTELPGTVASGQQRRSEQVPDALPVGRSASAPGASKRAKPAPRGEGQRRTARR